MTSFWKPTRKPWFENNTDLGGQCLNCGKVFKSTKRLMAHACPKSPVLARDRREEERRLRHMNAQELVEDA